MAYFIVIIIPTPHACPSLYYPWPIITNGARIIESRSVSKQKKNQFSSDRHETLHSNLNRRVTSTYLYICKQTNPQTSAKIAHVVLNLISIISAAGPHTPEKYAVTAPSRGIGAVGGAFRYTRPLALSLSLCPPRPARGAALSLRKVPPSAPLFSSLPSNRKLLMLLLVSRCSLSWDTQGRISLDVLHNTAVSGADV